VSLRGGEADEAISYFHGDHLGSSNVITDEESNVIARYEYRPFGSVADQTGDYSTDVKYTGKIQDDTGLYYYGARYYDPFIGRFITPDPTVQHPDDPQDLNRYAYCRNNPIKYVDPSGHFFFAAIAAIIKVVASYAVAHVIPGAIAGSLIGGGIAAITGGDIGQGFAMGAISGAICGGIGGFGFKGGLAILANGVGGAASGAVNASIFGGNVGRWAMVGGLSGLAFGSISQLGVAADGSSTWQWGLGRVGLSAAAGGEISELAGGSFGEGAAFAGAFAGADFLYRSTLRTQKNSKGKPFDRGASAKTATKPAQSKSLTVALSDDLDSAQTGFATTKTNQGGFLDFSEKGKMTQWAARNVPFVHGTSLFHDAITTGFRSIFGRTANSVFFNYPSMPLSYAINVMGAAMNDYPALVGQSEIYGEGSN